MELLGPSKQAFRALRRRPGVVVLAVIALALGIGLPAAIYSVLDATFLRGLPVEEGDRVMHLERRPFGRTGEGWGVEARDYLTWQESQRSFESLGAFRFTSLTLRDANGADRYAGARVTPNTFEILRVRAAIGRTFTAADAEPGAEPVVILGHTVWRDRHGSDPGIIGRTLFVDGVAHTVVGVMPEEFRFPVEQDVMLPFRVPPGAADQNDFGAFEAFGRLADGVSLGDARADLAVIGARVAERWPETNENMGVSIKPYTARFTGENATRQAWVMLGAVLLVLLVASVNVANLQLVRVVERLRDLAVRTAMGATRGQIMRQLFLESGAITLLGGLLGIVVTAIAIRGFGVLFPPHRMPFWYDLRLDLPVLAFIALLSVAAAFLAGVLPALKASGQNLLDTLNDESRGATGVRIGRLMQGLVVLEIAFSLALLVTGGLLLLGVSKVQPDRLGMAVDDVVTARIALPSSYDPGARTRYWNELVSVVEAGAAVQTAALATDLPATHADYRRFAIEGIDYDEERGLPGARSVVTSSRMFDVFGRKVVRGRGFAAQDAADGVPVVLVNERFARVWFGGEDPIGRRIRIGEDAGAEWRTIVGIAPDLWANGLDSSPDRNPPAMYTPLAQEPPFSASIAMRASGNPAAALSELRTAAFALEPEAPVHDAMTMVQLIEDNSWFFGMAASIMGVAGLVALLLATIGLYGVIAFSVGRRTKEIGIRMAFGATTKRIHTLILRRGLPSIAAGMLAGFALAVILARGISDLLFGVAPTDLRVFAGVGIFLAGVAVAAMIIPANRAASIHPLEALRSE